MLHLDKLCWGWPGGPEHTASLTVAAGTLALVSGPSGIGKTSLLNCLAGFLPARSGSASWQGNDFLSAPPWQRPISFLFQSGNLFDHLTARQNISLGWVRAKHKPPDQNAAILAAADQLALDNSLLDRPVSTLSGGQQQRVALARTLIAGHPVLLLDEPFAGLDPALHDSAAAQIVQLVRANQMACLIVSHDRQDAARLQVDSQLELTG